MSGVPEESSVPIGPEGILSDSPGVGPIMSRRGFYPLSKDTGKATSAPDSRRSAPSENSAAESEKLAEGGAPRERKESGDPADSGGGFRLGRVQGTRSRTMGTYRQPGTVVTDHTFRVPLAHEILDGEQIQVFAREVVGADKASADLPWLLFLQGGPGYGAPRPIGREAWLDRALEDYRVLLLDQRGTGRSSPANRQTLARIGPAQAQADYLANFRANSVVRDAELVRQSLIGDQPWSILGQSFGGFCAVTYLSFAPEGLREVMITGGLPGLEATAADIYRALYPRVARKCLEHYRRYPEDIETAKKVARYLRNRTVSLPDGGILTVEAFQSLGRMLGFSTGSHQLHYMLEDPFTEGELSDTFLYAVQASLTFSAVPLYALLHEASYAEARATEWSAQKVMKEFPAFDASTALDGDAPLLFTGEMIFPWTFEVDPTLRPLGAVAQVLAERDSWQSLYNPGKLRENCVPTVAVVYFDDMYVDADLSLQTAQVINGLQPWVTNEYEHDGLRVSNGNVLERLLAMVQRKSKPSQL